MKKFILSAAILLCVALAATAQPRAIGGRLGYGFNVSYQHGVGQNMVSVEAGLPAFAGVEAAATYDWINPFGTSIPWEHKGEWNWYMGVGGAAAWYWLGAGYDHSFGTIGIGVAGRIGVEYNFWFPLQLSIDWRPVLGVALAETYTYPTYERGIGAGFYGNGLLTGAFALGVRYCF